MTRAEIRLWGRTVGTVSWDPVARLGRFEYAREFAADGPALAPLMMPLSHRTYSFPDASRETFRGLPGLVADALPDRFGTVLTDAWLASQGRRPEDLDPVARLCFTGRRGMGALEFLPADGPADRSTEPLDLDRLVRTASDILINHDQPASDPANPRVSDGMSQILEIGTSAGGSRAKAVVGWTGRDAALRAGQGPVGDGFDPWLLKFDGVAENKDREQADIMGYGRIEHAYHKMAVAAGISMAECRLFEENGRYHFVTRRFDRAADGAKRHMQTLSAMAHFSIDRPGEHSYEQLFEVCLRLGLTEAELVEQSRRVAFNIVARNQDDHAKNTSFLMDPSGGWSLSPAYDLTFSYNPAGQWTKTHQTSVAGKLDGFAIDDFVTCVETAGIDRRRATEILAEVCDAVARWPTFAEASGVPADQMDRIGAAHRLGLRP